MLTRTETQTTAWAGFSLSQTQVIQKGAVVPVVNASAHKSTTRILGDENGKPLEILPGGLGITPMGGQIDQEKLLEALNAPLTIGDRETSLLIEIKAMLERLSA